MMSMSNKLSYNKNAPTLGLATVFWLAFWMLSSSGLLHALTWPNAQVGHFLDAGAWGGSTYTTGDALVVSNGNVQLGSGNSLDMGGSDFNFGQNGSSLALVNTADSQLNFDLVRVGVNGEARWVVSQSNLLQRGDLYLGHKSSGKGTLEFLSSNLIFATPKTLYIGREGQGNLIVENGRLEEVSTTIFGAEDGAVGMARFERAFVKSKFLDVGKALNSQGTLELTDSELQDQASYLGSLEVGLLGNGIVNMTRSSANISAVSIGLNASAQGSLNLVDSQITTKIVAVGKGSPHSQLSMDASTLSLSGTMTLAASSSTSGANVSLFNGSRIEVNNLNVANVSGASANLLLSSSSIVDPSGAGRLEVGVFGDASLRAISSNVLDYRNLFMASEASATALMETSSSNLRLGSLYVGKLGEGRWSSRLDEVQLSSVLYIAQNSGSSGSASFDSTRLQAQRIVLGDGGMVSFTGGNIELSGDLSLGSGANLELKGGHTRLSWGSLNNSAGTTRHWISSEDSGGSHAGLIQLGSDVAPYGELELGVLGGLAVVSSNTFTLQKGGALPGALGYSRSTSGYELSLNPDLGGGAKGLQASVSSGNTFTEQNLRSRPEVQQSSSFGILPLTGARLSECPRGITLWLKRERGTLAQWQEMLQVLAWTVNEIAQGPYDLAIQIPASALSSRSTHLIWDFRNPETGESLLEMGAIKLFPTPDACLFTLR